MSGGKKILDGLQDALSRNIERYTNTYTADERRMTDLERAAAIEALRDQFPVVTKWIEEEGEARGAAEMRERVAAALAPIADEEMPEPYWDNARARRMDWACAVGRCLNRVSALPLTPEEPAYRCVHGHDKCNEMYPGSDCPYCERMEEPK